jgi:hypothetical protein
MQESAVVSQTKGKGTEGFESYVRNLQLAVETSTIGTQLAATRAEGGLRRALIHNPYGATVADIGICRYRTSGGTASGR